MSIDPKEFQFVKPESGSIYPADPEYYENFTEKLPAGTYTYKISPWKSTRSLRQNRTFHGPVLDQLCETTGYEPVEMKEELKRMFLNKEHYIGLDGEVREKYPRTRDLSVGEMAEFMERIIRWTASTFGFQIKIDEDLRDPTLPN